MNSARDDAGMFAKFCAPTIVNGKVYLSTFSNQLQVYGELGRSVLAISRAAATRTQIAVTFNQPVDPKTAAQTQDYLLDGGRILAVKLGADGKTVYLKTAPLSAGKLYTLTASGMQGLAETKPMLPPATHAWFRLGQ